MKTKDNDESDERGFHLTDKQKKIAIAGAVAVGVVLAAYGAYRLNKAGVFDSELSVERLFGEAHETRNDEPRSEALKRINPYRGTRDGRMNCTSCAIASALQQIFGINAACIPTSKYGDDGRFLNGVVEECFTGAKCFDGSATSWSSRESASAMLRKRFGDNAEGVVGIQWRLTPGQTPDDRVGHAFNWAIKDGLVSFYDGQTGHDNDAHINEFFGRIDPTGALQIARLDCATPIMEKVSEFVDVKG